MAQRTFQKVRTGAHRRAQEIAFDVLTRDFHVVPPVSTHVHMGQHRELLKNLDVACSRGQHIEYELSGNIPTKVRTGVQRRAQEISPAAHLPGC